MLYVGCVINISIDLIGSVSLYNMMISIDGFAKIINRLTVFVEFGKAFKVVVVDEIVDTLSQNFFRKVP